MATSYCVVASYDGARGWAFTPSPIGPTAEARKNAVRVCNTPHDTLICNTAAKTSCQMDPGKGIITGWYGIFRCVGGASPAQVPGCSTTQGLPHYSEPLDAILPRAGRIYKPYFVTSHPVPRGQPQDNGGGPRFVVQGVVVCRPGAGWSATGPPWVLADGVSRAGPDVGSAPCNSPNCVAFMPHGA